MENTSALQLVRETDDFVASLIAQMDLAEKIGQMCQIDVAGEALSEELKARLSAVKSARLSTRLTSNW